MTNQEIDTMSPVFKLRRAGRLVGTLRITDLRPGESMGFPATAVEYRPAHAKEGPRAIVRLMTGDERDPSRVIARGVIALGLQKVRSLAEDHFTLRRHLRPVAREADRAADAARRVTAAASDAGALRLPRAAAHRELEPDHSPIAAVRSLAATVDLARSAAEDAARIGCFHRESALTLLDVIAAAVSRARSVVTRAPAELPAPPAPEESPPIEKREQPETEPETQGVAL